MTFLYYLFSLLSAAGVFAFLFLLRKKDLFGKLSSRQLVAILYGALFILREFSGQYAIESTVGLNISSPFGPHGSLWAGASVLLIWLLYAVQLLLVTYPFFEKHLSALAPLVRYASGVVYLLSFALLPVLAKSLDGEAASAFHFRTLVLAIEIGVGLALSAFYLVAGEKPRLKREGYMTAALAFLGMFFINLPAWAPRALFGFSSSPILVEDFSLYHRIALYLMVGLGVLIFFLFRRCSYEVKRYALIYISMATMISFCFKYTFEYLFTNWPTNLTLWPLHLCNTAMFIIPLVLLFKWDKLFYFTLFINVLGALLAMLMPNTDGANWLDARTFEFWTNHYMAFLMPILIIALGIFKRAKIKEFIYSIVAFFGYYVLVLLLNAWLTNYDAGVDFFFINSDFVADKLGDWALNLRNITLAFTSGELTFTIYPVYQAIYFTVYIVLSLAVWFVYEQAFTIADTYAIVSERNRKIKADRLALEVHLAGRSMQEPMNPQNEGKLILRHFSKRYSTSDVYAVYDANLEIHGGEIFGFLGPNGAGKSTIIKSIVGIQTITSGEIELSGYDVEKQLVGAKMQIGYVPDHYALYENLTGREYVNYIADLYNVDKDVRDERVNDYVSRFRLEHAIDNPIKTYSHGMKQKITIMSALVHNPKIWVLDEPLTGLDPESIFQVKECMKEHAARGNIVFFSSHLIDVVERVCHRIAIIRKGQILCVKSLDELAAEGEALESFYMNKIDGNTQAPVSVKEAEARAGAEGAAV